MLPSFSKNMKRFLFPFDPKQTPSYVPLHVHLPRVYWGGASILANQMRMDITAMPN